MGIDHRQCRYTTEHPGTEQRLPDNLPVEIDMGMTYGGASVVIKGDAINILPPGGVMRAMAVVVLLLVVQTALPDEAPPAPDAVRQVNLAVNPGFERAGTDDQTALGWWPAGEDQVSDWQHAPYEATQRGHFQAPQCDAGAARTGQSGLRLFGTDQTTSAVWQRIDLLQTEPRPIVLAVWSRFEGAATRPKRPHVKTLAVWAEFGIVNVRYMDGTKAAINRAGPLIDLRKGDGRWVRGQAVFTPDKPVRYLEVKADLHGAAAAAVLCVDDVLVAEVDATVAGLEARGVDVPPADVVVAPSWANAEQLAIALPLIDRAGRGRPLANSVKVLVTAHPEALTVHLERTLEKGERLEVLIAPYDRLPFRTTRPADLYRFRFGSDGTHEFAWGLTRNERAFGAAEDATFFLDRQPLPPPVVVSPKAGGPNGRWSVRIPFDTIEVAAPRSAVWRLNVCLRRGDQIACTAPTYTRQRRFGRLAFLPPDRQARRLVVDRVEASSPHADPKSIPPYAPKNTIAWGDATVTTTLTWRGDAARKAILICDAAGAETVRQPITLKPGRSTYPLTVPLMEPGLQKVRVGVISETGDEVLGKLTVPVAVCPLLTMFTYETFLYDDEDVAEARVWIGATAKTGDFRLPAHAEDWRGRRIGDDVTAKAGAGQSVLLRIPVDQMKVHDEPVADHWLVVRALDDAGHVVDQARCRVGRFIRPKRREGTRIEQVRINERGYLEVNGRPFYAVIASLNVEDLEAGYLKTPRLGFNSAKINCGPNDQIVSNRKGSVREVYTELYKNGVYAAPCFSMIPKDQQEQWTRLVNWMKASPTFLAVIGGEVYRSPASYYDTPFYLKDPQRPLVLEYHNCGNWLNVEALGKTVGHIAMFWSGHWQVPPVQTIRASYSRERAIKPDMGLMSSISLSEDPHFSIWSARAHAYISAIHGGTGVYLYTFAPEADDPEGGRVVELLRGLATEMRRMGPIFTADDQRRTVRVTPADQGLVVGERRIGDERFLMVVNPNAHTVNTTFELNKDEQAVRVAKRFEAPATIELGGSRRFVDELPARWARVFRISLAAPVPR